MPETRVLVIANNLLTRTGLAALLATQPDLDVVGQEPSGDNALIYRPDVVVVDLGYEPTETIPALSPLIEAELPLVVLLPDSGQLSTTLAVLESLLELPAYAVLLNETAAGVLGEAIAGVMGGLVVLDPELAVGLIGRLSLPSLPESTYPDLTPRENEVLQWIARGLTNKAIGQTLDISTNTVKFHVNAILAKLEAQSRTEAVVRATQLGLIVL